MEKRAMFWRAAPLALLLTLFVATSGEAAHSFQEFGGPAAVIRAGQGIEFVLGGVQTAGPILPELSFHLRLFLNNGSLAGLPEQLFSPGDVLRFTFGGVSIIYDYDNPGNILDPRYLQTGFFDAANIDDNFAFDDPMGIALGSVDVNGTVFTLEVLAGDGVRFSGLEFADTAAGTFQKGGASTFVRQYLIVSGNRAVIDFENLAAGTLVVDQYAASGVTFFGDKVYDEQVIVDAFGTGLERLEGRFLVNESATPPLARPRFVGMRFDSPVFEIRFDFAGLSTIRAAAFDGDFLQPNLLYIRQFTALPGPTGLPEGNAVLTDTIGFDGLILPEKKALLLDHVDVTFFPVATVDFEGLTAGTPVDRQFQALGVTFFGDRIQTESATSGDFGVIEGNYLVNDSPAPPNGTPGQLGMQFDRLVSRVSFDFVGPSPLRVEAYRGGFAPEHLVEVLSFSASPGPTGLLEGRAVVRNRTGIDRLVVVGGGDLVRLDDLSIVFLR